VRPKQVIYWPDLVTERRKRIRNCMIARKEWGRTLLSFVSKFGSTEENLEKPQQFRECPGRDPNHMSLEYKPEELPL